jgi:hypothetical protein
MKGFQNQPKSSLKPKLNGLTKKGETRMVRTLRMLAVVVMLLGLAGIAFGGVFIGVGISKHDYLADQMRQEQVQLVIDRSNPNATPVLIDSAGKAKEAADLIRADRHQIAPTYQYLLAGKKFDPTNPKELTYAQAMNMEDYLYLAVLSFGVTQSAMGAGVFMICMGFAIIAVGATLFVIARKIPLPIPS